MTYHLKKKKKLTKIVGTITKTRLFKYIENFTTQKIGKFSDKKFWYFFFYISAQNIDCGFSLERYLTTLLRFEQLGPDHYIWQGSRGGVYIA